MLWRTFAPLDEGSRLSRARRSRDQGNEGPDRSEEEVGWGEQVESLKATGMVSAVDHDPLKAAATQLALA